MKIDLHRSWGKRVRERRAALGMTQAALAAAVDITQASVSRIERGEQCPGDELKFQLAGALGETLENLFPYPPVRPPAPEKVA